MIDKTKRKILEVAYLLFFFTEELDWQFMCIDYIFMLSFNDRIDWSFGDTLGNSQEGKLFNSRIIIKNIASCKIDSLFYPIILH